MNRELRRDLSKRKWLSRAKKVYNSCSRLYIPIVDIKSGKRTIKACESISNFLDLSKYAKILKNCTSPFRSKRTQYEYKKENRKKRYSSKKDIKEGIQEYESRDGYIY